ncbi:hypothetical protein MTP99_017932 [Tenebrio molitor]|nr:hypothetical protein MTP99_017932 [Tenebrio molitor]CAH1376527.1 unnamed protein product [Tenebrio molitor]
MKLIVLVVVFALVCILNGNTLPVQETAHVRVRRFTCDVLSFEVGLLKLKDSICATHCILRGNLGGHCKEGVCNCRN